MGTIGIYAPLKYYGRVEIIQTPLYQYLIADFEPGYQGAGNAGA